MLEKVTLFIRHVRIDGKLGSLLRILVESLQLQAGISESVLDTRIHWERYVENTWVSSLKEGLNAIDGGIITDFHRPKIQRQYDRALMEVFSSWGLKKKELQAINRCRIYLKVIFVSDITKYNGTHIMREAYEVITFRNSELKEPRQVRPLLGDRRIWKKYIDRLCFNSDELLTTLGRWISPTHQIWSHMVTSDKCQLLRYKNGVQHKMGRIGDNKFLNIGTRCENMRGGFPVRTMTTGMFIRVVGSSMRSTIRARRHGVSRLYPTSSSMRKTLGQVVCRSACVLENMWSGGSTWKCATDGGLKGRIGTCGLVLWNNTMDQEVCTARSAETCDLGMLHSTREELRGNLAAEILLDMCVEQYGGECGNEVEYICDSRSAIDALEKDIVALKMSTPLMAEMDILLEIERLRKRNEGVKRKYTWVRSHQDDKILNANEKLNQTADQLATECRDEVVSGLMRAESKQCYVGSKAMLKIGCTLVNKDYKRVINDALFAKEMRSYLMRKYEWEEDTFQRIDWVGMEAAVMSLRGAHKVTVMKLLHLWQPTGKYVYRNEGGQRSQAVCPHCDETESHLHYMSCRSEYFKEARAFSWRRFCDKMKRYRSEETMLRIIWIGVQNWIYGDFNERLPKGDDVSESEYGKLVRAFEIQSEIGWDNFLVGRVAKGWSDYYAMRVPEDTIKEGRVRAFRKALVEGIWAYTLQVWKRRNEAVHGGEGQYSKRDEMALRRCVQECYDILRRQISKEDEWLFNLHVRIRSSQSIPRLIGWLERLLISFDGDRRIDEGLIRKAKHILCRVCKANLYLL